MSACTRQLPDNGLLRQKHQTEHHKDQDKRDRPYHTDRFRQSTCQRAANDTTRHFMGVCIAIIGSYGTACIPDPADQCCHYLKIQKQESSCQQLDRRHTVAKIQNQE